MLELIDPAIEWLKANWMLLAGGILAIWAALYFTARIIIVGTARWWLNKHKAHGGSRRANPLTWFKLQPWYLFDAKVKLLSNKNIREFYAPVGDYLEEREEGKRYIKANWLSPWMKAAGAASKQSKKASHGKHHYARAQVGEAAKHIRVRPLPDALPVAGDRKNHYEAVLHLDGKPRSQVLALEESIEAALPDAFSVDYYEQGRTNDSESFIVHKIEPESILTTMEIKGKEFFAENPAKEWNAFPMMRNAFGDVMSLPTCHTAIWGMTGSGKSSPINGTIVQAIPFVLRGEAELYGFDKKETELLPWEFSSLFKDIVYTTEDSMELISDLYERLLIRNKEKRKYLSFEKGNTQLQRKLPASKQNPMVLILIDEMLTLLLDFAMRGQEGKAAMAKLAMIMNLGRACGFHVYGATQAIDKEILGRLRDNFTNAVVFRNMASASLNEIFLGEGAVERGFNPGAIEQSTDFNGYKTSGIGYVKGETGDPVLVRFAHLDDETIGDYVRAYPNEAKMATLSSPEDLEKMLAGRDDEPLEDVNERIASLSSTERNDFLESLKVFGASAFDEDDHDDDGDFTIEQVD